MELQKRGSYGNNNTTIVYAAAMAMGLFLFREAPLFFEREYKFHIVKRAKQTAKIDFKAKFIARAREQKSKVMK